MPVIGADRVMRKLSRLHPALVKHLARANEASGKELIRIAKVLIPVDTGASKLAIRGTSNADGSYLADFGPKAKVIEGEGGGPQPFVNPALAVTRRKHRNRAARALKAGIKEAMGG